MKRTNRISPALVRIAERGMAVTEADIRGYAPSATDLAIAEAMLSGSLTFKEIAEFTGKSAALISDRLRDPLLCAWVSRAVHQQIHTRLGMLDAAMFRRALGGDVRAYTALMKRYGQAADLKLNINVGAEDLQHMPDEALDALIARREENNAQTARISPPDPDSEPDPRPSDPGPETTETPRPTLPSSGGGDSQRDE